MAQTHSVPTCQWGQPTLELPRPYWFQAADHAWSCTRQALPRVLPDPDICRTCEAWAPAEATLVHRHPSST